MRPLVLDQPCQAKADLGGGDGRAGTVAMVRRLAAGEELLEHSTGCANCPANAMRMPFGCSYLPPKPLPAAAGKWLLDRVPPPSEIGGQLALQTLEDAAFRGAPTPARQVRDLPANPFDKILLTTDELLALFDRDDFVPWESLLFLLIFAAVKLDDAVPKTAADVTKLTALLPKERQRRGKLTVSPAQDPETEPIRQVLKLLFVAWARDVDVKSVRP